MNCIITGVAGKCCAVHQAPRESPANLAGLYFFIAHKSYLARHVAFKRGPSHNGAAALTILLPQPQRCLHSDMKPWLAISSIQSFTWTSLSCSWPWSGCHCTAGWITFRLPELYRLEKPMLKHSPFL